MRGTGKMSSDDEELRSETGCICHVFTNVYQVYIKLFHHSSKNCAVFILFACTYCNLVGCIAWPYFFSFRINVSGKSPN